MHVPTKVRIIPLAVLCLLAAAWASSSLGWSAYVASWGGSAFKALSGLALGYAVCRWVLQIDISEIRERYVDQRASAMAAGLAGISLAIVAAGTAIAIAVGA